MLLNYNEEWILSNMNGSYSSSSASFANLRTYHGLFVKRVGKDYERQVLLAKLFEELALNGNRFSLDTNYYRGAVYPEGYRFLTGYDLDDLPTFRYRLGELNITKSIVMDPKMDWLVIKYDLDGDLPSSFYLHPLLAFRNHHLALRQREINLTVQGDGDIQEFKVENVSVKVQVDGKFVRDGNWYYNFQYPIDRARGSNYEEDLFHPGYFELDGNKQSFEVKISCTDGMPESFKRVKGRMLMSKSSLNGSLSEIARRSTAFITEDDIIAGFYWFGPWSRDTLISLPGLLLVTKRFRLAKKILEKYASMLRDGVLPSAIGSDNPAIDSSLWLIYAIYKYYKYTNDKSTVKRLYPVIIEIINSYIRGNDVVGLEGHLIRAKKPQLTWMDAKTGDKIFTPRMGLPVEVNALWYNALSTADFLASELGLKLNESVKGFIPQVRDEFREKFVSGSRLMDTADPDDWSLRPNFIFAFSLPFPVMEGFSSYVGPVNEKLLTDYGLRSLSPDDPNYVGRYEGDQYHRDMAYHNGSVWPWLAGPYITASVRSGTSRAELLEKFRPLMSLRMIPEIFDGDDPHEPRGCIMQAWSYGELMRAHYEDLSAAQQ